MSMSGLQPQLIVAARESIPGCPENGWQGIPDIFHSQIPGNGNS